MNENIEIIEKFTSILRDKQNKKPLGPYPSSLYQNTRSLGRGNTFTTKDVIAEVSKQMKDMQKADCVPSHKKALDTSILRQQSSFLPLNTLSRMEMPPQPSTSKFNMDTQSVLDTQLLGIIQDAESLAGTTTGITQEFETTFWGNDEDEANCKDEEEMEDEKFPCTLNQNQCPILDISLKPLDIKMHPLNEVMECDKFMGRDQHFATDNLTFEQVQEHNTIKNEINVSTEHNIRKSDKTKDIVSKGHTAKSYTVNNDIEKLTVKAESSDIPNECKAVASTDNADVQIHDNDVKMPLSPILTVKRRHSVKKSSTSPLVFDLKMFETFEEIATSVLDKGTDLKTAKQLITTQVSDKEIFVTTESNRNTSKGREIYQLNEIIKPNQSKLKAEDFLNHNENSSIKHESAVTHLDFVESNHILATNPENGVSWNHQRSNENVERNLKDNDDDSDTISYIQPMKISINKSNLSPNSAIEVITDRPSTSLSNNSKMSERYSVLKDEILFSSDEEEYIHKSIQDLPLTCALETSFFDDQSDILDKTMYVGFQTANDKSIQVLKKSFSKAKSFLEDSNEDKKGHTVTALVDICSSHEKTLTGSAASFKVAKIDKLVQENLEDIKEKITDTITAELETSDEVFTTAKNPNTSYLKTDIVNPLIEQYALQSRNIKEKDVISQELFEEIIENYSDCKGVAADSPPNSQIISFTKTKEVVIETELLALGKNAHLPITETKDSIINHWDFNNEVKIEETFDCDSNVMPSSQIISLGKSRTQKRKQAWLPTSASKRKKINFSENKFEIREKIEDIVFDTCDFDEISIKDDKIPDNETDEIDSKPWTPINNCPETKPKEIEANNIEILDMIPFDTINEINDNIHNLDFKTASNKNEDLKKGENFVLEMAFGTDLSENSLLNKDHSANNFERFKTASNKYIDVSDESIEKSKILFNDIENPGPFLTDFQFETNTDSSEEPPFHCFLYTKEDKIKVQKEIESFKKTFEEQLVKEQKIECIKTEKSVSPLFETKEKNVIDAVKLTSQDLEPSSGPINISEEALIKLEFFFKDLDATIKEKEHVKSEHKQQDVPVFKVCKTDTYDALKINTTCPSRTRKIFENIDQDPDDVINEVTAPRFQGFQTASKKPVQFSAKALAKSRKLFQDIDKTEDNLSTNSIYQEFQTHSRKPVRISPKSLARCNKIFENIDLTEKDQPAANHSENNSLSSFEGFQTASNKKVNISAEALAKRKKIFQDIDSDSTAEKLLTCHRARSKETKIFEDAPTKSIKIFQDIDPRMRNDKVNSSEVFANERFEGFKTASNKQVKVSEEALAKSKKIFNDIDSAVQPTMQTAENFTGFKTARANTVNSSEVSANERFQGFNTASNKQVKISIESLAKSKKIFNDIDSAVQPNNLITKKFTGFQTASNKQVKVSEEALAKSKKIFNNIDSAVQPNMQTADNFTGFKTASNKQVKISEEALAKSKKIFNDLDSAVQPNNQITEKFTGFQTASNKQVKVSEEALAKSKKIFNDIDSAAQPNKQINEKFSEFQTAGNKRVKISEEALVKSKKIFENIDAEIVINEPKPQRFQGFQTGNNKEIVISEEALVKSRQIFQDIEAYATKGLSNIKPENTTVNSVVPKDNLGFQTARNKKITISEDALAKSRKLFVDIDNQDSKIVPGINKVDTKTKSVDENIDNMINTQILNNFEQTLYSEDFFGDTSVKNVKNDVQTTPKIDKRSGSPILSCPKSKKRKKFEIPYSQRVVEQKDCKAETNIERKESEKPFKVEANGIFEENYKTNQTYTLKDLAILEAEAAKENAYTDPYLLNFNFETLLDFEFHNQRNNVDETKMNIQDLIKKFEDSVNKKLIPKGWIENHIKLILWKLLSYEIKFPKTMTNVCTVKNVLQQLKYRYDKELFNAERPALRKILEKDDVPSKTLVLCVAAIFVDGVPVIRATTTNNLELLLTDGWYLIKGSTDRMLSRLVCEDKLKVGSKIVTNGAELVGGEQGVAPWEDTSAIRLKLCGNSTRRARWDARLGYHGNAAILSRLTAVRPDGGKVSKLRAFVARVYPALYVEKFEDGSTVTRSERLEHLYQTKYETDRIAVMEKLYEEVERELSDEDNLSSQLSNLENQESKKKEEYLQKFQNCLEEKMSKYGLTVARNVVPLLKARIADVEDKDTVEITKATISIWKPNDAIREIVTEGAWIEVLNVVPTSIKFSEMQISAGRQSIFIQSNYKEPEKLKPYVNALKRSCYPLKELVQNLSMTTDYNEIDTVGFIFQIDPENKHFDANKQQFQNVYLTDASKNIICINFWGGLKKFGFENILDTGQTVSCTNLQKRAGNTRKSIPQYRATEFSYFTKTPRNDSARKLIEALETKLVGMDRAKFCSDCISWRSSVFAFRLQNNTENVSPYRFPNIDTNLPKNNIFIDTPLAERNNIDENLNLTGLDFESTFKQKDTQETPKTILRKQQLKEKLDKLKMYGEPPPLIILNSPASKNVGKAFKSPLISDSSLSVASENKIVPNREKSSSDVLSSPVLEMNRTYVKRIGVNPVKLNFSNNIVNDDSLDDVVDHFAEDFDGSPPLSLD